MLQLRGLTGTRTCNYPDINYTFTFYSDKMIPDMIRVFVGKYPGTSNMIIRMYLYPVLESNSVPTCNHPFLSQESFSLPLKGLLE